MPNLTPDDEQAAERLAFQLLHGAFYDLSSIVRKLDGSVADKIFDVVEDRLVGALSRLKRSDAEGENSNQIVMDAGAKLSAILDEARGLSETGMSEAGEERPPPEATAAKPLLRTVD